MKQNVSLEKYDVKNWRHGHKRWAGGDESQSKITLSDEEINTLIKWRTGVWISNINEGFGYDIYTKSYHLSCWCKDLYPVKDERPDKYYDNCARHIIFDRMGYKAYLQNVVMNTPEDGFEVYSDPDTGYARELVIDKGNDFFLFESCCGRKEKLYANGICETIDKDGKVTNVSKKVESLY